MIAVLLLCIFSKKCTNEKTRVKRSQSMNGNNIVHGILQFSIKSVLPTLTNYFVSLAGDPNPRAVCFTFKHDSG